MSEIELEEFLEKLNDYEPGIINIIQYYTKTYTFESNKELKDAVKLWNTNKEECIKKYGHISDWDTGLVTDMSHLFEYMSDFNQDISGWDTGNVTNMRRMFDNAVSFNQDISGWDTNKVVNRQAIFYENIKFRPDLSSCDISNIIIIHSVFEGCNILEEYKPYVMY